MYSDEPDYVAGTFVWSGFDYLGEARGWPQNTKCRGTVADVAGFTKETAYWIKSVWLSNISKSDAGRPVGVVGDSPYTTFIVESWVPGPAGYGMLDICTLDNRLRCSRVLTGGHLLSTPSRIGGLLLSFYC